MTLKLPINIALLFVVFSAAYSDEHPNIIIIYADDLGFGDVSCNDSPHVKTPAIDRLAQEGLRFTDAHCSAATCTPSRYSLLTGQYAFRQKGTGILPGNANLIIEPGTTTMPSVLQNAGYKTGVVGKWHLGLGDGEVDWNNEVKPGPNQIGFDYHFLIPATGDRVPCVYLEQGLVVDHDPADPIKVSYRKRIGDAPSGKERPDLLKQKLSHGHDKTIVNGISRIGWMTGGKSARWIDEDMADVITNKATEFIDQNQDQQFFLFFSTHDIHVPRVPHSRFVGSSGMGPRGDAITQLDWCVGKILEKLDKENLSERTLVIFTSDNGPVLDDGYRDDANEKLGSHDPNGPFRAGKYSLFEGGTRVPMLVRWPGKIAAGSTSNALFGQVDLAASLAKLVEVKLSPDQCVDSRNELDTLLGVDPVGRSHLLHEARNLAIRCGGWKYIPPAKTREKLGPWKTVQIGQPGGLYNLEDETSEMKNLAESEPEQLAKLRHLLEQIRKTPDRELSLQE